MLKEVLTVSALIAVVLLVRAIFKNRVPKRMLYALWLVVLLKLCLPGTLVSLPVLPAEDAAVPAQSAERPVQTAPVIQRPAQTVTKPQTPAQQPVSPAHETAKPAAKPLATAQILQIVWFSGSALLGLWLFGAWAVFTIRLHRDRRFLGKGLQGKKKGDELPADFDRYKYHVEIPNLAFADHWTDFGDESQPFFKNGIPMSNRQEIDIDSNTRSINLEVIRMVAKVQLSITNTSSHPITIRKVVLSDQTPNSMENLMLFPAADEVDNQGVAHVGKPNLCTQQKQVVTYEGLSFSFAPIDLYRSHATRFVIEDGKLLPPFVSVSGLGETAAWDIMEGREGKEFLSIEEFSLACPKGRKTPSIQKL